MPKRNTRKANGEECARPHFEAMAPLLQSRTKRLVLARPASADLFSANMDLPPCSRACRGLGPAADGTPRQRMALLAAGCGRELGRYRARQGLTPGGGQAAEPGGGGGGEATTGGETQLRLAHGWSAPTSPVATGRAGSELCERWFMEAIRSMKTTRGTIAGRPGFDEPVGEPCAKTPARRQTGPAPGFTCRSSPCSRCACARGRSSAAWTRGRTAWPSSPAAGRSPGRP